MPRMIEFFCGTKSISSTFEAHHWECVTIDILSKFQPTIVADILDLPTTIASGFDYAHFSPPCQNFSRAHTGSLRDIDSANKIVLHVLAIIRDSGVKCWTIENPATGLLKSMPYMEGLEYTDASYCRYGFPYRKNTRFWNNFDLKLVKCNRGCDSLVEFNGRMRHIASAQKGKCKNYPFDTDFKTVELYRIPPELCEEILIAVSSG
jgi:site-specific DNA-cytosine methylase